MKAKRYLIQIQLLVAALPAAAAISAAATPAETNHTAIPFSEIGAGASQRYTADGLSIARSADGASLRCVFQKLHGRVTSDGLWLTSTAGPCNRAPFRVVALSVGREHCASLPLAGTGEIEILSGSVRFHRAGLDEEYSVSVDGIRQDLIVTSRLAGNGALRVDLAVDGSCAEALPDGARLVLDASGRELAYNHLKVTDDYGRKLTARMEVVSPNHLAVVVDDADAAYPVRIDPTFSDANWVSMGSVGGLVGANGAISATVVDANGNVYVAGGFTFIVSSNTTNIAKWNGTKWSGLGSGITGFVSALACDSAGNLYAGGFFSTAGGVSANNIAKWNGSTWSALGVGINGSVSALACDSSGNLFAGGAFSKAGGVSATNIAKWNGSTWSALGSGINGYVYALALDRSENLLAGGPFSNAGGVTANNIAKWNGNNWSALGSGINGPVDALACDRFGNLYAGGYFGTAGGVTANNIAKWNGTNWSALYSLGAGVVPGVCCGYVYALACDGLGNLYVGGAFEGAGGTFSSGAVNVQHIAMWNSNGWSALIVNAYTGVNGYVNALACDSAGNLYAGGSFSKAGGLTANSFAKWDGKAWSAFGGFGPNVVGQVNALACDRSGNLYVESSDGFEANAIAEWNGDMWSFVATNTQNVFALACDSSGNLYAGGNFGAVEGVGANNIAKWNGSTWSALGSGINGEVYALAFDKNGNLYAGGYFGTAGGVSVTNIARWNGSSWSGLGSGVGSYYQFDYYDQVLCLACDHSGNLYAGGTFSKVGGLSANNIAKWNGSAWSPLGSGIYDAQFADSVYALACDSSGNLYVGGDYGMAGGVSASGIAKWNGSAWSPLGSGMNSGVLSVACDTNGNLYAGGTFSTAGGVSANRIAKWNGSAWFALGSGMTGGDSVGYTDQGANTFGSTVNALALDGFGSLYAGGNFYTAGTNVAFYVADALLTGTRTGSLSVTLQPTNNLVTVAVGSSVSFGASVNGTGPFFYQWQLNGTNLPNGIITTVAGNGTNGYSGDGGPSTNADFNIPSGMAVDAAGNVFISDSDNFRIREVRAQGIITTVAGNGTNGYSGDGGVATNAELNYPQGVAVDATGNLFIADSFNGRVRKVGTNGIITTVAGNGTNGYSGDGGAATNAELNYPNRVAVDATGNLLIADTSNGRIRKVDTNGIIATVAGDGNGVYSGDGGAATNAGVFPVDVVVDAVGNLLIADSQNRIREVNTNGIITTIAGNGNGAGSGPQGNYYSGDGGEATNAELNYPQGVAVDATGNLFIADSFNGRVRKVGTNGIITTVAGNGTHGYSGDEGAATNAELSYPAALAVDPTGNVFIADSSNERIRKVLLQGPRLVLSNLASADAGAYDVVVSSPYGSVTSSVVNLTITTSKFVLSAPQFTSGKTKFIILLSGPPGSNYVLQVSTNLFNWSPVSTSAIPISGSVGVSNAVNSSVSRFYRAERQ